MRWSIVEGVALIQKLASIITLKMAEGKQDFDAREIGVSNEARLSELRAINEQMDPPLEDVGGTD